MFAYIANAEYTNKAQAMIDFRFSKGTLNRFLALIIDAFALWRLRKEVISSKTSCQTCLSINLMFIL